MPKTIFRHKIFLVLLGLFLTIVLLEGGLRVAGIVFLRVGQYSKKAFTKKMDAYRILCLGESTTILGGKNSYPRQLEDILNSNSEDIKFEIINKGIPSVSTTHIISHLEQYLDEYQPHMIIVMMGINDASESLVWEDATPYRVSHFFEQFRVYKLVQLIATHASHNISEKKKDSLDRNLEKLEVNIKRAPSVAKFMKLAGIYRASNKTKKEKNAILKALEINPNHAKAWAYLGLHYKRCGKNEEAIPAFKKALMENRRKSVDKDLEILSYAHLAESYRLEGKPEKAEEVYFRAIRYLPSHPGAYGGLGELYLNQGKYKKAEMFFQQQLRINPKAGLFYGKLAHCYRRKGRHLAAEKLLKDAVKINPEAVLLHKELGSFLLANNKYQEAEKVLKKALELNKKESRGADIDIYNQLLASYVAQAKAGEILRTKNFLRSQKGNYNPQTRQNYQKLKGILSQRKIQLVAVQYPMRALDSLTSMLHPSGDIIFVDNKKIFEKAITLESYDDYFLDRFAGSFGHCTAKGNRLLAGNIAKSINNFLSIP